MTESTDKHWRTYLLLMLLALTGLVWIFRETAASLVSLWQSSETYTHGFIIFPISLYLVWRERTYLATLTPRPSALALAMLAVLATGWTIAQSADVQVIAQYLFVAMIPALTATLFGTQIARAIAFPLAFTLLAVPFGEVFIRPMIDFTADFTVTALQMTGIPVFREGSHFALPSGNWSVVEACSGLRYLIASFTLGCLYAYMSYRSRRRQIIFVFLSIVVPVIANGIRAYLIVLLGHLSSMKIAVGVDHLIYGWLFFGFVMLLLFWIGGRWREDEQIVTAKRPPPVAASTPLKAAGFTLAALAIAWAAPLGLQRLEQYNPASVTLNLPQSLGDWRAQPPGMDFKPVFPGAAATLMQEYRNGDRVVGIYLAFFRNQNRHAKAISSQNMLADEALHEWSLADESMRAIYSPPERVLESRLLRGDRQLLAWQWYKIGQTQTANPYLAKFLQAKRRLTGQGDDVMDIVIYTTFDTHTEQARAMMGNFLQLAAPALQLNRENAP